MRRVRDEGGGVLQEVRECHRRDGARRSGNVVWPRHSGVYRGVLCWEVHRPDHLLFRGALRVRPLAERRLERAQGHPDLLEGTYGEILDHISEASFVQLDESPIRMNGKRGCVWLATVRDATYVVAAPSRAAAVLDIHFGKILGVPVVSDGYVAYDMLPVR